MVDRIEALVDAFTSADGTRGKHYTERGSLRTRHPLRSSYELGGNMHVQSGNRFDLRRCAPISREEEHRCAVEGRRQPAIRAVAQERTFADASIELESVQRSTRSSLIDSAYTQGRARHASAMSGQ